MTRSKASAVRVVLLLALCCLGALLGLTGTASARVRAPRDSSDPNGPSGYYVTFVARSCPSYKVIFANKARNDILESLKDLGPDSQYLSMDPIPLINPQYEEISPQTACSPLPDWQFTLGRSYESRAVTGVWGSLSKVTGLFDGAQTIKTEASTPLLNDNAEPIGTNTIAGATTIQLTNEQRAQATHADQLWAQGGTPDDPVLAQDFAGPLYAFGALRCATDNLNGDNVEYIYFPAGVEHVFCYGLYVKPAPTSGTITIKKTVNGAPEGTNPSFPFNGSLSFDPNGFTLANGGSMDFYRAGGSPWVVTEGDVENYKLTSVDCTATGPDGKPAESSWTIDGAKTTIRLVADEHVTCVYNNTYSPPGGLVIQKKTYGGVGTFGYDVTPVGGGTTHHLEATTTKQGVPDTAEPSLATLTPGRYTVREDTPSSTGGHWHRVRVVCEGATNARNRPVAVTVVAGQTTNCLFVNEFIPIGSISLSKTTFGATGTVQFLIGHRSDEPQQFTQSATTTFTGTPVAATPNTPQDATDHLPLGRYTIVEQFPPSHPADGWAVTSVKCNGLIVPFQLGGAVTVTLTPQHPSVHCAYVDTFTETPPEPPIPPIPPNPIVPPGPTPTPNPTPGPPPSPNDISPVQPLSDLAITKTASHDVVTAGGVVTYVINVTSHGPDAAQDVVMSDQRLGSATVVSVHAQGGTCTTHNGVVMCKLGTLKKGASRRITVRVRPARVGDFVNRAVVGTSSAERTLSNNTATATIRVVKRPHRHFTACPSRARVGPIARAAC